MAAGSGGAGEDARHRSAAQYPSVAKVEAERLAQAPLSPAVLRALRDAEQSCKRGMGPSSSVSGLPLECMQQLPDDVDSWGTGGPIGPKNAIVIGTWFMLREIELSNLLAKHCQPRERHGNFIVSLYDLDSPYTCFSNFILQSSLFLR